jgi:hypothetical protein
VKTNALSAIVLVIMLALSWSMQTQIVHALEEIKTVTLALKEAVKPMQQMTSAWSDSDGNTHSVTTTRQDGESVAAFTQRHKDAVEALQAIYPPA